MLGRRQMFNLYWSPSGTVWIESRQANNRSRVPVGNYEGLNHSIWEWKYHIVFISKCRRKTLFRQLLKQLGKLFRENGYSEKSA